MGAVASPPEKGVVLDVMRRLSIKAPATTRIRSARTAHSTTDRASDQVWIVREYPYQRPCCLVCLTRVRPVMVRITADRYGRYLLEAALDLESLS